MYLALTDDSYKPVRSEPGKMIAARRGAGGRLSAVLGHVSPVAAETNNSPAPLRQGAALEQPSSLPQPAPLFGLTPLEQYFFDVNGYVVRQNILSPAQVAELNAALDANAERVKLREGGAGLSRGSSALAAEHGRGDTGAFMQWPSPSCLPFRRLLTHHPTVRLMLDLIGEGFHYHQANGITMTLGAEGHTLHGGGGRHGRNHHNAHEYSYREGEMYNNLMGVMYQLADVNPGDGGFCCIPGSHSEHTRTPHPPSSLSYRRAGLICSPQRHHHNTLPRDASEKNRQLLVIKEANFPCPPDVRSMEAEMSYQHVAAPAGSAILFTEALTHGAMPWLAVRA